MAKKKVFKTIQQKKTRIWGVALTDELMVKVRTEGITPETIRDFIENYGLGVEKNPNNWVRSDEWENLLTKLVDTPSLQLIGDVNSGKTYLTRLLIKEDKSHIFIVLDAHNEFDFLPEVNTITPDLKESCRIKLPDQPAGALGMFSVYYNLITNQEFPKHYVLVIEEALRYKEAGIKNLLAEARKFLKILAITQEQIVDFVPHLRVIPYN